MTAVRKLSQDAYLAIKRKASTAELLIEEIGDNLGVNFDLVIRELELRLAEALNPGLFQKDIEDDAYLGRKIEEARKVAKLTQIELANKANITQGYLSKVENGTKGAPQELVQKIAEICGKPYDWFFE